MLGVKARERIFEESGKKLNANVLLDLGFLNLNKVLEDLSSNVFKENYTKLVIKILFLSGVCMLSEPVKLIEVRKAVVEGIYASFKAQVLLTTVFRKHSGEI